jgi:hypothetical protein
VVLPDREVGILCEAGAKQPYENVVFARFPIGWLTQGGPSP